MQMRAFAEEQHEICSQVPHMSQEGQLCVLNMLLVCTSRVTHKPLVSHTRVFVKLALEGTVHVLQRSFRSSKEYTSVHEP